MDKTPSQGGIFDDFAKFLTTGILSDFTITCGSHTFKVHKVILAAQSEYFHAVVTGQFKESTEGIIDLKAIDSTHQDRSCDDPAIVKIFVDFFYHDDYMFPDEALPSRDTFDFAAPPEQVKFFMPTPDGTSPQPARAIRAHKSTAMRHSDGKESRSATSGRMLEHAQVFAIAYKYGFPRLKQAAQDKFCAAIAKHWSHHSFARVIDEVYSSTPEEVPQLRDVVAKTLLDHPVLLHDKGIKDTINEIEGLPYRLLILNTGRPTRSAPTLTSDPDVTADDFNIVTGDNFKRTRLLPTRG